MTTPIVTQPSPVKLTLDEQNKIYAKVKGTPLEIVCLQNGTLDPNNIREYKNACNAFATVNPATNRVKEKAIILSRRDEPVLIMGESGTGKELLARIIHGERTGNFVGVNVCAVTDSLFESELFGHVRGAFTGADKERDGLIRHADGGTLFLDEIGDMPMLLQAKMLRVIQNRTFRKVGGNFDEPVRCRIVAATHRNMMAMIRSNTFRLDLYERINVFQLRIPPLRDRLEDIALYVGADFAKLLNQRYDTVELTGNVRQLLNLKLKYDTFGEEELTADAIS